MHCTCAVLAHTQCSFIAIAAAAPRACQNMPGAGGEGGGGGEDGDEEDDERTAIAKI
jgi:hypothetical protein